jgi:hypothetical protein
MSGSIDHTLNTYVNEWLHYENDHMSSPIETIKIIVDLFWKDVEQLKLNINVSKKQLFEIMCEGICMYYISQYKRLKFVYNPKIRTNNLWDDEKEELWMDFLTYNYFNTFYWERFWSNIPEENWECDVPLWRQCFQSILPFYVDRSVDILIANELLFEAQDGNVVTAEDYDSYSDDE